MNLFVRYLMEDPAYFLSWIIVVMFSICVHEYAHARVALELGDSTAADEGHLTLNPLVQMGPVSIIMLFMIGIAWGAVPVNPTNMRTAGRKALVSFAGPGANLALSILFALLTVIAARVHPGEEAGMAEYFFYIGAVSNSVLFIFNMLPVPMFDGWSVFALVFPAMDRLEPQKAQGVSVFILMIILFSGVIDVCWAVGETLGALFISAWMILPGI